MQIKNANYQECLTRSSMLFGSQKMTNNGVNKNASYSLLCCLVPKMTNNGVMINKGTDQLHKLVSTEESADQVCRGYRSTRQTRVQIKYSVA